MLTPRSYLLFFHLFWLSCVSFGIRANTDPFEAIASQSRTRQKKKFTVYFPPLEIQPPHHLQNPFTTSLPNHIRQPSLNTHTYQATRRLPVNQSPLTQQPTNPICQSWPPLKHHTSCQKSQPPQPTNHKKKKKKKEPTQAISHQPRPTNQPLAAANPSATRPETEEFESQQEPTMGSSRREPPTPTRYRRRSHHAASCFTGSIELRSAPLSTADSDRR